MGKRYRYEEEGMKPRNELDEDKLSALIFVGILLALLGLAVYLW